MKKIILALAAALLSAGLLSAQDMATATATYNNGAEALTLGNKEEALKDFQDALKMGEALGADAEELVANCKKAIPGVILSIGKELYNNKDFDGAISKMQEASKVAKEYGIEDVAKEADELIPQISVFKDLETANEAMNKNDFASAAPLYKKVLAADSTNAGASIRLVQCLSNLGDLEGAKEALKFAQANGQGDNAAKVIGGAYLKKAVAELKGGKFADAIATVDEADNYTSNPQAYLIAGQAATKLKKNADAIKYYEKYLEADPNGKQAGAITFTVAALYQQAGNKAKAKEYYQKILSDPKFGAQAKQQYDALNK